MPRDLTKNALKYFKYVNTYVRRSASVMANQSQLGQRLASSGNNRRPYMQKVNYVQCEHPPTHTRTSRMRAYSFLPAHTYNKACTRIRWSFRSALSRSGSEPISISFHRRYLKSTVGLTLTWQGPPGLEATAVSVFWSLTKQHYVVCTSVT